jgi:hypothetical protein
MECWRLPKFDPWGVCALWQINADRIVAALGLIIFAQLVAQPCGLDANERIDSGIEAFRPIEDFEPDTVAFQPLAAAGQSFIDEVL